MIFEQPKELNPILFPPEAKAEQLWLVVRLAGAPLTILLLFMAEIYSVRGRAALPLFGVLAVFPLVAFLMFFAVTWRLGKSKRSIQIDDEGLRLTSNDVRKIPWSDVVRFQFEPAGSQGQNEKLTVFYRLPRYRRELPWRMILADEAQCEEVLALLEKRRTANPGQFTMEILKEPQPRRKPSSAPILSIWALFYGGIFLMHGIIALVGSLSFLRRAAAEKAPQLLILSWHAPFAGVHDLGRFLLTVGSVLTVAGIVCLWRFVTLIRKAEKLGTAHPGAVEPKVAAV